MKDAVETDPVLVLVDTVIDDLGVGSPRFVARRAQDGDGKSFVLQDGEEGRLRLTLPDLSAPGSVVAMVQAAQHHLCRELGQPVPRCPEHEHALQMVVSQFGCEWVCPDGGWRCLLGQYALSVWPCFDRSQLPEMLARRLHARQVTAVWGLGVEERDGELVAVFQVNERTPGLVATLRAAAAPLPVDVQEQRRLPRRVDVGTGRPRAICRTGPDLT